MNTLQIYNEKHYHLNNGPIQKKIPPRPQNDFKLNLTLQQKLFQCENDEL